MLAFATENRVYRLTGLALLLAMMNVFVICMPPFQVGIWVQSEPATLAVFIGAALAALWLAAGCLSGWLTLPGKPSPLLLCLLAWTGWQLLVVPTAQLPWRAWFGPPQTGDGTAMSIATLLIALLGYPLWQDARLRRLVLMITTASLIIQCALHFYYPEIPGNPYIPDRWIPALWPEYLPFLAAYLWIAAFSAGYVTNIRHFALSAVAMVFMLLISRNKTADALFLFALLAITIAVWVPLPEAWRQCLRPGRKWRIAMMVGCVLPFTLVLVSPYFPSPADYDAHGIRGVFSNINDGFGSRMMLDRVGMSVLKHEPSRIFWGNGWGTFTDDLFKYALISGVYSYKNGQHIPNWFLVEGSSHHSHNQPLEALLSLGFFGLLLWYAIPLLALWRLPENRFWTCAPIIVALTGLGHFWFQLPQCFPYQSLYYTALFCACDSNLSGISARSRGFAAAFALACLSLVASSVGQYRAMMHADGVHNAIMNGNYQDYSEDWIAEDLRYGGDRWATSARYYATTASNMAARHELGDNILGWYTCLMHVAHKASQDPQVGPRASALELRLQYYLFGGFDDPMFQDLRHEATVQFEDSAIRMIHKAPLRDDYTAFFLMNLPEFTHHNVAREIQILRRVLAAAPDNRGALWVLGRILFAIPDKQEEGRKLLQRAIDMQVETVYPVTDAELAAMKRDIAH